MFTLTSEMWNDGPPLPDFMGSEGAPRVAIRHLCSGGGGNTVGQGPDYSQYIKTMTDMGGQGYSWAKDLMSWAKSTGVDLTNLGKDVSGKAMAAGDAEQARSDQQIKNWDENYGDVYKAQSADAKRMMGDLPAYQEQQAGKYGADAGTAIDQGIQTQMRNMRAQGFSPSAVASDSIGRQASVARQLGITQQSEAGREAAKTEARGVADDALTHGMDLANVSTSQGGAANTNRGQAYAAQDNAARTGAAITAPAQGMYTAAEPYMQQWGDTMKTQRNQDIQSASLNAENSDGGIMSTLLPLAGGIAGSFLMPGAGTAIGGMLGGAASKGISMARGPSTNLLSAEGGRIPRGRRYAGGGGIDTSPPASGNYVPPEASPSGGDQVDDVPAMVSAGEFVIPKRTVDWLGDKFFQKLIQKTDQEIASDTTAAPEEGAPQDDAQPQMAGIDAQPPMFRSEGAMA